jgi:hypothetical protein
MQKHTEIIIILISIGVILVTGCMNTSPAQNQTIQTPVPTISQMDTTLTTKVTLAPENTLPAVVIVSQKCAPTISNFMKVTTVLKNNQNTPVNGDIYLKVYNEGGSSTGTFKESVSLPPNGENLTEIVMYGVDYHNTFAMSTEYPGLSQTPPPRESSGYMCPNFKPAQMIIKTTSRTDTIAFTPNPTNTYVALETPPNPKSITILSIGNRHVGDKFTIVANTNIDAGEWIRVGIYPFSAKYLESVSNSPSAPKPIVNGMNKVLSGGKFTFDVDTATFEPGEYTVIVTDSTNTVYNFSEFFVIK